MLFCVIYTNLVWFGLSAREQNSLRTQASFILCCKRREGTDCVPSLHLVAAFALSSGLARIIHEAVAISVRVADE